MEKILAVSLGVNAVLAGLLWRLERRQRRLGRLAAQHREAVRRMRLVAGELREPALALAGPLEAAAAGAVSRRLLDLAELLLEDGEGSPRRLIEEPIELRPLIDFVVAQVSGQLAQGRRAWRLSPALDAVQLLADRRALHQVLLRVMSAAALATRDGDWIDIAPLAQERGWALGIEDEGLGLLVAGVADRGPESRGIGLGLTLARSLMVAHGGALRLESAQLVGTRAVLVFPEARMLGGRVAPALVCEAAAA